jgi:hypothetical protein
MSNNKQSSVEWLTLYIKGISSLNHDEVIEQAKAMHKDEIKDALLFGDVLSPTTAENYYKVKFGGNNGKRK